MVLTNAYVDLRQEKGMSQDDYECKSTLQILAMKMNIFRV